MSLVLVRLWEKRFSTIMKKLMYFQFIVIRYTISVFSSKLLWITLPGVHTIERILNFAYLGRFDPKKVKYMQVKQIALKPEGAKVGIDIRVVG
jgi:hypothetical protein